MLIKYATIVFDKKYDIFLQDIRKKYIVGTYRIKQNLKKISIWPRIEQALSRLQDQRINHSATAKAIACVRV